MTHTADVYRKAGSRREDVDYLSLIKEVPATGLKNYVFRNSTGITFTDETKEWGLDQEAISNGTAYADFDNDGDYDLITNNLNQPVTVLRNNESEKLKNNFIRIKLIGSKLNSQGTGAKIWLETEDKSIFQEAYTERGYLSSSDPVISIGLGSSTRIKSLKVRWPDGRQTIVK